MVHGWRHYQTAQFRTVARATNKPLQILDREPGILQKILMLLLKPDMLYFSNNQHLPKTGNATDMLTEPGTSNHPDAVISMVDWCCTPP